MLKEVLKRGAFVIIGLMIMFAGLIMFNIPIQDDVGEESEIEDDEEAGSQGAVDAILFFGGVSLCFGVGPYFLLAALLGQFLHQSFTVSEAKEKRREKREKEKQALIDHYWEALGDENHPHHNFVKRAKWKDKIKWKHRPLEIFVHFKGDIVPKKSPIYKEHRRAERKKLRSTRSRKEWDFERSRYVNVYDEKSSSGLMIDINLLDRRIWGGLLLLQLPLSIGGLIIGIILGNLTANEILTNVIISLIILLILTITFTDLLSRKK